MPRRIAIILISTISLVALGVWWLTAQLPDSARVSQASADLGRALFQDTSLSATRTLSCASCHDPAHALAQQAAVPTVYNERTGTRNVPSLLDLPYFTRFFWDGREASLERAVVAAFTNHAEMAQPHMGQVIQVVRQRTAYREQFKAAFGDEHVDQARIAIALQAYLASVTTGRSRYDAFFAGDTTAMTASERRGLEAFIGKADCASCHALSDTPAAFTDNQFHHSNVGLDRMAGRFGVTITAFKSKREAGVPMSELVLSDPDMAALGRFAVTGEGADLAAYRTPTLRNVTRTPPYMHDGSVSTLDEAIQREIYYRSLARGRPISLTVEEQSDLRAFLDALEDVPKRGL